jgi:AmmeMemoRadiSam system protein A
MSRLFEAPSEKTSESLTARAVARGPGPPAADFSLEERRILLHIAHEAILSVLERRALPETLPLPTGLSDPRGVFTTLYMPCDLPGDLRGQLRGCVGYAVPIAPLYRAVAETARAAAFEDSRFMPVTKEEALKLEVSLSVLSRLFPIHPEAVDVGRHGLVVSQGTRRGLLLPQVSVENGWDRETFLEQTCRKAGLPSDAWRKDATIEAFTAEIFADADDEVPG